MPEMTPITASFGEDGNKALRTYVHENIMSLKTRLDTLHQEKINKWRRLYRGVPKQEIKNFPWKNASNVIIQLIGENCDIIRARILGTIFEVMPLWVTSLVGDWSTEAHGGEQQEAIQEFMNYVGLEPGELDLYRVESQGVDEQIKFGTVLYALPWVRDVEAQVVGQMFGKAKFRDFTKYEGPRPEKVEFESWGATPSAATLEAADFKYRKLTLTKQKLEERFFRGIFKFEHLKEGETQETLKEAFLSNPDRPGPSNVQSEKERDRGMNGPSGSKTDAEWDIHECWFPYFHNGKKFRLVYLYHFSSERCLRSIFNIYPNNEEPFELARFGYTDDGLYGYGLCEMLEYYQEEVSTNHNQRCDNRTLANTSIFRVDPNSKLDAIFSIYPNALIPANDGELEKIQLGANYPSSVQEEELTLALARSRAGTDDPGFSGAGGGTVSKKGAFSAMGTFAVMQAGNRRVNINITDAKYVHHKMGRKFLKQYAEFGIGERASAFGQRAQYLQMALKNVRDGRLILPIRAATASINKELEKQNDMLLTQVMQRHHMGVSQILQAINNPSLPPEIKNFLVGWIDSSSLLMGRILRNFGHDDISRMLPERKIVEGASENATRQQGRGIGPGENAQGTPAKATVVPSNGAAVGPSNSLAQSTGGGGIPQLSS